MHGRVRHGDCRARGGDLDQLKPSLKFRVGIRGEAAVSRQPPARLASTLTFCAARKCPNAAATALRPGCEQLAARIRVMPGTEARPRVKNRHGGAPRGERPVLWDARRLASARHAALWRAHGCSAEHPNVSRRSAHPSIRVGEARLQTPGAKTRRGNEVGCLMGWTAPAHGIDVPNCGRR
jgi:hypothetical protein